MKDSRRLRLTIGPVFSSLEGPAPAFDLIDRFSVVRGRGRGRSKDTFRCFRADQTFYTGLVPEVAAAIEAQGIAVVGGVIGIPDGPAFLSRVTTPGRRAALSRMR